MVCDLKADNQVGSIANYKVYEIDNDKCISEGLVLDFKVVPLVGLA